MITAYNSGVCDYYGYMYGETETVKECHFWVLITVYYINVMSSLQIVSTECLQVAIGRSSGVDLGGTGGAQRRYYPPNI